MVRIVWIAGGLLFLTVLIPGIFTPTGGGNVNGDESFIFEMPG